MRTAILAAILVAVSPALARAGDGDKDEARALVQTGVALLNKKDYRGALAVFKDAYARFPSTKLLINIGVTLARLDRKAEAANTYQRYLDAADADAGKKPGIEQALAALDASLGVLELTVTPPDAEVQINDEPWVPAASVKRVRVEGEYLVRARKEKFQGETKSGPIGAGQKLPLEITLAALPEEPVKVITVPAETGIGATFQPEEPRSRLGMIALANLDISHEGVAARAGLTLDVIERLQVQGTAILGPTYGAYAGASFALMTGKVRPLLAAGMPIFFSDGARIAVRGAGGVELQINRHVAVIAELGLEYLLNPENDIKELVFIPSIGASARL